MVRNGIQRKFQFIRSGSCAMAKVIMVIGGMVISVGVFGTFFLGKNKEHSLVY
jgi:hypothetical protein